MKHTKDACGMKIAVKLLHRMLSEDGPPEQNIIFYANTNEFMSNDEAISYLESLMNDGVEFIETA